MNAPINCVTCKGKHWTPREIWACQTFGPVANYRSPEPITTRQLSYIIDLGGDKAHAMTLDKAHASKYIDDLKSGRVAAQTKSDPAAVAAQMLAEVKQQNQWSLTTPQAMVEATRDGRYAVRHDENEPFKFIRISRPKHGKKKGCLILQTQHSDFYKECVIVWPSGRVMVIDKRIDPYLLLVVVDPVTAARKYGQELGVCCSCGRELTDHRSIHYGIGPECEKRWPEVILQVDEEHGGPYNGPGA